MQAHPATHVNVVKTTEDTSSKLGPERVPNTVLDLLLLASLSVGGSDTDSLFTVDGFTGNHVPGNEQVLLALGDKDTGVLVRLKSDGVGLASESWLATTSTTATSWCTTTSTATTTGNTA